MPKLIIPYKEIVIEGKIDGPRRSINRLALNSDMIAIAGAGVVQSGETDQDIDMKLSYPGAKVVPLSGQRHTHRERKSRSAGCRRLAAGDPETRPGGRNAFRPGGALAGKMGL